MLVHSAPWKLAYCVVVVLFGMLSTGTQFGWTSPILPKLQANDSEIPVTSAEASWMVSIMPLADALSIPLTLLSIHKLSRKLAILLSTLPFIVCYSLVIVAKSIDVLFVARVFGGLGLGMSYSIIPIYLGEISPKQYRGFILLQLIVMENLGVLWMFSIAPFVSIQLSASLTMIFPLILMAGLWWTLESPYYYIKKNRREDAERVLVTLHGQSVAAEELQMIEETHREEMEVKSSFLDLFRVRSNLKSLAIISIIIVANQFGGGVAVTFYAHTIFKDSGSELSENASALIIASVDLVASVVACSIVEKVGKRPLLITSTLGSSISMLALGTYFYFYENSYDVSSVSWLPLVSLVSFIIFNSGTKGMNYALIGEVFATNVKAFGVSICKFMMGFFGFAVGEVFSLLKDSMGTFVPFWMFFVVSFTSFLLILSFMPETNGKSLEEIQVDFKKKGRKDNRI